MVSRLHAARARTIPRKGPIWNRSAFLVNLDSTVTAVKFTQSTAPWEAIVPMAPLIQHRVQLGFMVNPSTPIRSQCALRALVVTIARSDPPHHNRAQRVRLSSSKVAAPLLTVFLA